MCRGDTESMHGHASDILPQHRTAVPVSIVSGQDAGPGSVRSEHRTIPVEGIGTLEG